MMIRVYRFLMGVVHLLEFYHIWVVRFIKRSKALLFHMLLRDLHLDARLVANRKQCWSRR